MQRSNRECQMEQIRLSNFGPFVTEFDTLVISKHRTLWPWGKFTGMSASVHLRLDLKIFNLIKTTSFYYVHIIKRVDFLFLKAAHIASTLKRMETRRCQKHTYAVPILVESQGAVPRVQVHSYDRALTEPRRELHFVSFVLEQTFKQTKTAYLLQLLTTKDKIKL